MRESESVNEILEGMDIEPGTLLPESIPTPGDVTKFRFREAKSRGVSPADVKTFRNTFVTALNEYNRILSSRDDDVKKLADAVADLRVKVTNSIIENEQLKARGVEIVQESINGVDTDIAVENAKLKTANKTMSERITQLEQEVDAYKESDSKMRAWGDAVNIEYARMEKELADAMEEVKRMKSPGSIEHSIAEAKKQFDIEIAAAKEEKDRWKSESRDKEEQIEELTHDRDELRAQLDALSTSIDEDADNEGEQSKSELEQQVIDLEKDIEDLRSTLEERLQYEKKLEEWANSVDAENRELQKSTEVIENFSTPDDPYAISPDEGASIDQLRRQFPGLTFE